VAWPSAADFSEAVQSPPAAFRDPELRGGKPELNNLGMPKPRSGGFAVVFKLQCGAQNWAVKCFTRAFADQQQRYGAISRYLDAKHLSYTVGFKYLPLGISIGGKMYPVLKMEWVEGENLRDYIERHLSQPQTLRDLAAQWANMINGLHQASIAHGDLQDRNVIISNDVLKLIDYDGMFVPDLAGYASHELGARNYQHPLRCEHDFGPYLDNFSAWVVYLSLIGVAAEPSLWRRFGGGDERLVFGRSDFDEPNKSEVLRALENSADQNVRSLAKVFRSLLYLRIADIPSLDGQIVLSPTSSPPLAGNWLDDYVHISHEEKGVITPPTFDVQFDPSWILDDLSRQTSPVWRAFENSTLAERIGLACSMIAVAIAVVLWQVGFCAYYVALTVVTTSALAETAFLIVRYVTDGSVRAIAPIRAKEREVTALRRKVQRDLDRALNDTAKARESLASERRTIDRQRQSLNDDEERQVRIVAAAFQTKLDQLQEQVRALNAAEVTEITQALHNLQQAHVNAFLARATLSNAKIDGIGQAFKASLMAYGYRTALDIDAGVERVSGIGPMRRASLMFWRQQVEYQARASAPASLAHSDQANIQNKYAAQRRTLEAQGESARRGLADKEREIRSAFRASRDSLDRQAQVAQERCEDELKQISIRTEQLRKSLFRVNWDAAKVDRELMSFRNIHFQRYVARVFFLSKA
jgi:hypothetical protein